MMQARFGHSATVLRDGRVLIVGGENEYGPVDAAEIYDPVERAFKPSSNLRGRSGHAAVLLSDGRVLITGGRDFSGPVQSTHFFDPLSEQFTAGPAMRQARAAHTVTDIGGGRLLVVGGDQEGTLEVFDPALGSFVMLGQRLDDARNSHSATLLHDGTVLIAGGLSASGEALNTGAILNPWTGELAVISSPMRAARVSPVLRVLSDGKVQVIGGDEAGTMEMFNPVTARFTALARLDGDPRSFARVLRSAGRAALIHRSDVQRMETLVSPLYERTLSPVLEVLLRTGHALSELPRTGDVLVTGGRIGSGALATAAIVEGSAAEVTTNQTDYYPGETVVISGTGFQPGEMVTLVLEVQKDGIRLQEDIVLLSEADDNGNFQNSELVVDEAHLGATFLLTATGQTSGITAQTTFTDSPKVGSVVVSGQAGTLTSGIAGTATYTITVARGTGGGSSGTISADLFVTTALPLGVTASFSPNPVEFAPGDAQKTATLTLQTTTASPPGSTSFTVRAAKGASDFADGGGSLIIGAPALTVTADPESKTYGDSDPSLTYKTSGSLVSGDSLSGALARAVGENVGSYAINRGTLKILRAGVDVTASYNFSFVGASLEITPRAVGVTADAKTKIYGDADPELTYQVTSGSLVAGDSFSGALERAAGEDVGNYAITQGTLALSSNYTLSFSGANFEITPRAVGVTADAKTKTYGDADPELTYQVTSGSLVAGDSFSGALERAAGEDVGNYAITQGTLALSSNYTLSFNGANFEITPRAVGVTADPKTKIYGDADPELTYQVTSGSLVAGDSFSGALERAAGEDVGNYAITQGTLALSSNYTLSFSGANFEITPRAVGVTADAKTKIYGDADPELTYQVTSGSLVAGDSFSGALARAAGEDVGNYAITQGTLALSSNYTLSFSGANFEITPRAVGVTADAKTKIYGDADPELTYQVTSGSLVAGDSFSGALARAAGEDVGNYAITQGTLALSSNYTLSFNGANFEITPRAVGVTADAKTKVLGAEDPILTYQVTSGSLVAGDSFSGELTRVPGESIGSYAILQGTLKLSANYQLDYFGAQLNIQYAGPNVACNGQPCHTILQPINPEGSSVFKKGSTVPAKFRVCDVYGHSIGTPGVVAGFQLVGKEAAGNVAVNEPVDSTTPDTTFRWSPSDQLWIFNINTKNLSAGAKYIYEIALNDGSKITFCFGLK